MSQVNKIKERICSMFKDTHASEQSNLAKSLLQKDVSKNEDVEDIEHKLEKHAIIHYDILMHSMVNEVSPTVYKDVEFNDMVFPKVHQCSLVGGTALSKLLYNNPISCVYTMTARNEFLQELENTYVSNKTYIDETLSHLASKEKYVLWMFDDHEANLEDVYNVVFFKWKGVKRLNQYGGALTSYNIYRILLSPLVGILSPVIYFIIPYLVIVFRYKIKLSFVFYIRTLISGMLSINAIAGQSKFFSYIRVVSYLFSAIFYFQSIFSSIDISTTCYRISNLLTERLNNVISYIETAQQLLQQCWTDKLNLYFDTKYIDAHQHIDPFLSCLRQQKFTLFSNFGEHLKKYKILKDDKLDALKMILQKSYMLDCIIGSIKYKISRGFCYASVSQSNKPMITMEDMIHPSIEAINAVANSIEFSDEHGGRNAIITSPNSSGKSVLIKGIIVNLLMAQSIGICCAKSACITPFKFINTQINVPDSTGYESLFEAEMHRCKHNLDKLCAKHRDTQDVKPCFSLIVMDEIFSSTNPVEAVAGAFAVCKKMASYESNILIFTTHFNYLTKLAKEPKHSFVNYRMGTLHDEATNKISFTYKFEKGVNKHLLALELLKKSGFDDDVIDDAITIKKALLKK